MSRRYRSEPIEVVAREDVTGEDVTGEDGAPAGFRWRGRRYVVRAVMTTWVESVPWWPQGRGESRGRLRGGRGSGQQRVWRVEAAAATGAVGVYELCRIRSHSDEGIPSGIEFWGLLRVLD